MATVIVTGSAGLIGSTSVHYFAQLGFDIVGIDNDLRAFFFGQEASTLWNRKLLKERYGEQYRHYDVDIRDHREIESIFKEYSSDIALVIHAAAQPSHDWAAKDPQTDFTVNANGTLLLLEATRVHAPEAVFIFTSTNKVYGDRPNELPLFELAERWDIVPGHPFEQGIDETMPIDQSKHSLFGASKVAADILVQEYGRYFGMKTVAFRGGCLAGPSHSGAMLHGFLAYLMRCTITSQPYTIFGYKGKQVRDNIHSLDLVKAFHHFYQRPRCGEVYNIGGSRHSNCSVLEAIRMCQEIAGKKLQYDYTENNRSGDHVWYISDVRKFQSDYPGWNYSYGLQSILQEIYEAQISRGRA